MAGQQMLLLQQQVTLLTQLLQQSQQQNTTLASQVQQMTQELSGIKKQLQLGQAATPSTAQQQQAAETAQLVQEQQEEQQQLVHQAQQPVHAQDNVAAPAARRAAAAETGVPVVGQQEQAGSAGAVEAASPAAAVSAPVAEKAEEEQQPAAHMAQTGEQEPAAPAAGGPDTVSSAGEFEQAVYRCRSWQQLQKVLEDNQQQQQLQPWQLLTALRQLSRRMDRRATTAGSSSTPGNSSHPQSQQQQQQQQFASPEDLGCALLQQLLQHPQLWVPATPGLACALYPLETQQLLLAVGGLSLQLPCASNDQLQALYEDAVHHGTPAACLPLQQQDAEQQQQVASGASWVLSADQQVQMLGGCLTLGLKPLQQQLQLLASLQPGSVASFSLLGSALLVFVADVLLANRMLGSPAAAAGSLPPPQAASGEVPPCLLAAALQQLGGAAPWQLNKRLGCRRMRQLLLLPLLVAASAAVAVQATSETQEEGQQEEGSGSQVSKQQQPNGYIDWCSAVLAHLGRVSGNLPLDQLLATLVALAQHHTQQPQQDDSSSSSSNVSSGTNAFLEDCSRILDAAVGCQMQAANSWSSQQQHQRQQLKPYSSQQLAVLLPQLQQAGLQPSSGAATGLLQLILLAPQLQQQAAGSAGGPQRARGPPPLAQPADLAVAYTAASQLRNAPDQQLAALVAALAGLRVSLAEPLGPRSLDGKAKVTYGMVLAAAASAAASPATLAATPPDAVAQLAAGVAALGGRPDAAWWRAVQQRLAGQLAAVAGQRLQRLLGALLACGVQPSQEWLQEACRATLTAYDSVSAGGAASLQQLRQQSSSQAARLIACSALLVQLGAATLPQGLLEALLAAVDVQLLLPFAEGAVSAASPLQPGTAASLLADAGCALAAAVCEVPQPWLARYAAVAGVLLPVASGDGCCRLAAAACGLGCQLSPAWLREAQRQLDAKVASASSASICSALAGLSLLSARPTPLMANTLVIKTQQQLATAPVTWCAAAVAHLTAAAAALPPLALLRVVFAAACWRIKLPKQLLQAAHDLGQQQLQPAQLLPQQQLSTVASALLAAGQAVPQVLVPHLPEGAAAAAAAAAASEGHVAGQSPPRLAEGLWQQARSLLSPKEEQCSSMDAGVVAAAVEGLQGMQPSELVSCMKPPERWSIVLQAFAQQQQQQQQQQQLQQGTNASAADMRLQQQPDVGAFVACLAAAVQQMPGTALVGAGGPSTLLALRVVGAEVQQPWLAALVADMDAVSASKASWFKTASAADVLAYLQALTAAGRVVSGQQLAALAKYLPGKLQALPAAQLVLLLQLLPAAQLPPAAGTPAAGKLQPQLKQQQQAVEAVTSAVSVLLLEAAKAGQLQPAEAQQAIAALVSLGSRVLWQLDGDSEGGSSSKGSSSSKRAQAQQSQQAGVTAEGVQQLLCVALGSPEQQQGAPGGVVACLADVEAGWQHVGPHELAALPRMAALAQLELAQPQLFVDTVLLRLQGLLQMAKVSQVAAVEAAAAGAGPAHLLHAAVLQVMNKKAAEAGNSTWEGLVNYVVGPDSSTAGVKQLSTAAGAASLSPNQQQALLIILSSLAGQPEQQQPEMLRAVLSASLPSLERWPTAMLPFTLQQLGALLLRWAGEVPQRVAQLLQQWQQTAIAALQPRLHLLPASSYVQLLLGCSRLKLGMVQAVRQDAGPAGAPGQPHAGQQAVDACLRAALLQVSGLLDELGPDDCVRLLAAYGSVAGVGPALGQELLARLQPQLSSLTISQLVDAINAFAKCPDQARPEMPPAWLEAFLAATGKHLQQAMPVSVPGTAAGVWRANLPAPPPRAWLSQFVLAAVGMVRDFSGQQAAELLHALACWKQTAAARMASGGSGAEAAAAAHASFAACLPLYDALMLAASRAGCIAPPSVGTANGGLGLRVVEALPASLRQLQWPADEEAVQAVLGYIAAFRQQTTDSISKLEPLLQTRMKQLQQLQGGDARSAGDSGSKKERKGSSRNKQRQQQGGSTKQQQAQLQEVVVGLQQVLEQAAAMLQALDATADNWQQLLQPASADGSSEEVAAATAAAAAAAGLAPDVSAGFSRGQEDRMVQELDVDSLLAGMMQAAGVPQPAAAAGTAAGNMAGSSGAGVAAMESELDELLGGLAMLSELQGTGWGLPRDQDEEGGDRQEAGQEYIDTVAEDVV
ncbi:hypothetical protein COO60DRAFT_1709176 [Scenedesmus sp. NREL 46B-D3]|nr:hypothetical protein COO60DRAFT_1709176 [Scenedesmus sp. NREL 46B-D3]